MITESFAHDFAQHWVNAWNQHDLATVLQHYTDDFEMSSPIIQQMGIEPTGVLKGKAAISEYWQKALSLIPNLHFELENTLAGANSIVLFYRGHRGHSAEVFYFNSDNKVYKAAAHYSLSSHQ